MKRLELVKGLSFSSMEFSCKKGEAFCVDDEKAEELLSTGRFKMLGMIAGSPEAEKDGGPMASQSPDSEDFQNLQIDDMDDGKGLEKPCHGGELTAEFIEKLKKDDLIALAAEKGIDIKDCNNNDKRIDRIKEALGLSSIGAPGFDE